MEKKKNTKHFVVQKSLGVLEGLTVEVDVESPGAEEGCYQVLKITNTDVMFGDRNISRIIEPHSLYISGQHLVSTTDPSGREYSSANPFGEYVGSAQQIRDGLQVSYSEYEDALQVTVTEHPRDPAVSAPRTIYSQNFFEQRTIAKEMIGMVSSREDAENLIFELRQLKKEER